MDIQRDEAFEEAYSKICNPIIARPYPRNGNGEYFYKEIHEAHLMWLAARAQAVSEGFVLVSTKNVKFFSHDFNGDGFQYHDTLKEAKKSAEADLDIYRDRVADGNHIADMGEFNELAYGIVMGQAEWSVDCIVSADDHKNGEYTEYGIGTEILSLYLSEAREQSHD